MITDGMVAGRDPGESEPRPSAVVAEFGGVAGPDPRAPTDRLLRDLRTGPSGLSEREAQRRLVQGLFDTAALPPHLLLFLLPFPFIVWAVDDVHRRLVRARRADPIITDGAVA